MKGTIAPEDYQLFMAQLHERILKIRSKHEREKCRSQLVCIQDALLDDYMRSTSDIRMCPRSRCKFGGVVCQFNPSNTRILCSTPIHCEVCRIPWLDSLQPSPKKTWRNFRPCNRFSSLLTNLRKILSTEPCPNCGVSISKSEGCEHMICRRCDHEFCWHCLMPYSGYKHQPPQYEYYCPTRQVVYFVAIVFCI
jgi:hypothetical protein